MEHDRYRRQTNTVAGRTCDACPATIAVGEDYCRVLTAEGKVAIYDATCFDAVASGSILLPTEEPGTDTGGAPDSVRGADRKEHSHD